MNIMPRLSAEDIIRRAESRNRRDRWIAFCIMVGTVAAFLVLVWALRRTN